MSMRFSLTGADLAATLRRLAEDAAKRALSKRAQENQNEERRHDQPDQ
ncbi:hypothetical protein FB480_11169 [Agrobacterium vitis]|nr:hypothetical protein FB480_11169 [Agrobacterium vitis]